MSEESMGTGKGTSQAGRSEESIRTGKGNPGEGRNLEWRCLTCEASVPPTVSDYMRFIKHPCEDRKIWLVDKDTGEQLTNQINVAKKMGLVVGAEEKGKGKEEVKEPEVSSEGIFRYTISLPADAFMLFNIAKSHGLEKDGGKPFDEWVWDCIKARFEKDYKMQLVLAPVAEEKG